MTYGARYETAPLARSRLGFLFGLPFTCFCGALVTDALYLKTYEMMWADFSAWLLAGGCILASLAVLVACASLIASRALRQDGWAGFHLLGLFIALLLAVLNSLVHSRDAYTSVYPLGILLSVLTVLVLVATYVFARSSARRRFEAVY
jgi:uncharacterized membrane protein